MRHLELRNNGFATFPIRICFLRNLRILDYDQRRGRKATSIPENIAELKDLEVGTDYWRYRFMTNSCYYDVDFRF